MDSFSAESSSRFRGGKEDLKLISCWGPSALPGNWHRKWPLYEQTERPGLGEIGKMGFIALQCLGILSD